VAFYPPHDPRSTFGERVAEVIGGQTIAGNIMVACEIADRSREV
jgi:hypothetical protein